MIPAVSSADAPAPSFTAFAGMQRVASGSLPAVAQALAPWHGRPDTLLLFDDRSGAPVDVPPPPGNAAALAQWLQALQPDAAQDHAPSTDEAPARRGVGRPRLGVVAREVTLLPRHWDWLSEQPGGASVALRRLVEVARRVADPRETVRRAGESVYRFMSAMAGNEQGFEEAARALFGGQRERFETETASWPADIRDHVRWLAREAFEGDKTGAGPASDPARARAGARTARRGRE